MSTLRSRCTASSTGAVVEHYDCNDAGKPIFLEPSGLPTVATQSAIPFRWLAPACAWEPEIAMFQCPGDLYSPDLGMGVSSQKEKPKKTNPDRASWNLKENVK